MNSKSKTEHIIRPNYESGQNPAIEVIHIASGKEWHVTPGESMVLFALDGILTCSLNSHLSFFIRGEQMVYLPANYLFHGKGSTDVVVLAIHMYRNIPLYGDYNIENLIYQSEGELSHNFNDLFHGPVAIKQPLLPMVKQLASSIEAGLLCNHYLENKVNEVFYLLRSFYPEEELNPFFYKPLPQDNHFYEYVTANYNKFPTIAELASSMNYTLPEFEKRFFQAFDTSPHRWAINQKISKIFQEISSGNKKFNQISEEYGFSSPSAFNDFCRKYLNVPPGKIRKKMLK